MFYYICIIEFNYSFNLNYNTMKKFLLLSLALCIGLFAYSQQNYQLKVNVGEEKQAQQVMNDQQSDHSVKLPVINVHKPNYQAGVSSKAVVIRDLGSAGNAWGLSSGGRTFMWADDDINSVVFLHRMDADPGTGYLAYDVSTDNGDTWVVNQQVWDPTDYPAVTGTGNARYPQVGIYNPAGNTDPANAIITFFAPTLDQSNGGSWGGYAWGTNPLTAVNPSTPTQLGFPSPGGDYLFSVPDAFHILSDGKAFAYEPVLVDGLFDDYTGNLVITQGYYDDGSSLFDYNQELFPFDISAGGDPVRIVNSKVAFHPDGQTGYLAMLTNNGSNELADLAYYPILFKTTDGGANWDGPYNVQLGGPHGLPAVLNYLTDALIERLFVPPLPDRTEIPFTTGFDMDVAVDINGNPHISFVVGVRGGNDWSIITSFTEEPELGCQGLIALIHAASYGDMSAWYADTLTRPYTFRGTYPGSTGNDLSEDLRPYISVTPDASKLFFSWQNTRIDNIGDNNAPDIYCTGYRVSDMSYTQMFNVTAFTSVMWKSWMATASYYVFDHGGEYEIPFVCQDMNPANNIDPVTFQYVDEFRITDDDFGFWVSTHEYEENLITVSQNFPNPFNNVTYVNMTLSRDANVTLEVSNILGQKVKTIDYGHYSSGLHKIAIEAEDLESGIYFFTLTTGLDAVTRKMIIE